MPLRCNERNKAKTLNLIYFMLTMVFIIYVNVGLACPIQAYIELD
jgi:hypothetical protein